MTTRKTTRTHGKTPATTPTIEHDETTTNWLEWDGRHRKWRERKQLNPFAWSPGDGASDATRAMPDPTSTLTNQGEYVTTLIQNQDGTIFEYSSTTHRRV